MAQWRRPRSLSLTRSPIEHGRYCTEIDNGFVQKALASTGAQLPTEVMRTQIEATSNRAEAQVRRLRDEHPLSEHSRKGGDNLARAAVRDTLSGSGASACTCAA